MITPKDSDFHPRDPNDRTWTETTVLIFAVPEEGILGNAYVISRPNLGICHSAIFLAQGICTQPYQMDFCDPQMHLPCPESFSKYTLGNGLSVEATQPPNHYHMTYEHALGACSFDLNFRGIHDPFDPHDPDQNPLKEKETSAPGDERRGDEWENGHFEVKGHITGTLELRGKHYEVDCYDGMDHSWGPRTEVSTRSVSWISINFGDDLCMHLAVPMNIKNGQVVYDNIRFGYVVEDGQVHGLVEAKVKAERVEMIPINGHIEVTDVRGKKYEFYATAVAGCPWYSFNPCHVCFNSLMRYQDKDGRIGYGEFGDIFGLEYLADRLSRHARKS